MPNWVRNEIQIQYNKETSYEDFKKYCEALVSTGAFDFNNFVKQPVSITETENYPIPVDKAIFSAVGEYMVLNDLKSVARLSEKAIKEIAKQYNLDESYVRSAKACMIAQKKTGYANWYDWNLANWGTKWNCGNAYWDYVTDDVFQICFETAWSTPDGVMEEFAKKCPYDFDWVYSEEQLTCYNGVLYKEKGEIYREDKSDDYEFACEVWGYDPEEEQEVANW